ncbi:MAG: DUF4118 domain-containing protein [Lachnospiraceae bacterium]|nr:DUF4118 domain-containing protein [Lachnospiraceae bacterium]
MNRRKSTMDRKTLAMNTTTTIAIMGVSTIVAEAFFHYSKNSTSVAIIYVLAVMMVARYTVGYIPGIIASLFGVVFVNYVFTYPYMTLNFSIDGYPITFVGMMVTSGITSALTTKFKKQNQMLNEREKLLMEAEKETMRANLLRAVSHDLRTPLTSIIGLANTYLTGEEYLSVQEKREIVQNISEDSNWLLNMVENLLSVTRIRVGDASVNTNPEPLEEVVSEAVMRFHKRLPDAQVKVRVPETFLMVPMDAMLIEQVLINLLENGVYHSGVQDALELYVEQRDREVVFHIRDYGKGIEENRMETLFDGAGTDNNASGDSHKGVGIGLTICKTIVTAHHGKIWAVNRDKGAEILFTLPLGEEKEDGE